MLCGVGQDRSYYVWTKDRIEDSEWTGQDRTGLDVAGLKGWYADWRRTGQDGAESNKIRHDWVGQERTNDIVGKDRMDRTGLDRIG